MAYQYERVVTPGTGLRLHLNENTAGCSPRVLDALRELTREHAAFYPDYEKVNAACAAWLGVRTECLTLTNGLDEGILAASVVALRPTADPLPEAVVVVPAFDMYAACADLAGGRIVEVPLESGFAFPLDRVLGAIRPETRLIFITNPNNPTGSVVPRTAILAVAQAAPHALVFVDEAYADFSGESLIDGAVFDRQPNIVIGRTFAKAHGLAALRVGALVAAGPLLQRLRRALPPYNLNVCAAVALRAALDDSEYFTWYLDQTRQSKSLLYAALDRLGIPYWKSAANFVLADFGSNASLVVRGLAERGVFVRDRSTDPACPGCVRITAGIVEHTERCIDALTEVLCAARS